MAVYTVLERQNIIAFIAPFGIGPLIDYEGVAAGTDNTNYFIRTDQSALSSEARTEPFRTFVLTLFENISAGELVFYSDLSTALNHYPLYPLPIPCPLTDADGKSLHWIAAKPALLVPKVNGKHPEQPSLAQCASIGQTMAHMHQCCLDLKLTHCGPRSPQWLQALAQTLHPTLPTEEQTLLAIIPPFFAKVASYPDLPQAVIHSDLFRDNVLFEGDQLKGIIDFNHAGSDYLLMDLAITVNDWCSDAQGHLIPALRDKLVSAYSEVRPLSTNEQKLWHDFLCVAAARFWASRLATKQQDLLNVEPGRLGEYKDPNVYKTMLLCRLKGL